MTNILQIQECRKTFDFSPEASWPSQLPVYCYENELLCGFDRTEGEAINLPDQNLSLLFKALYPELSFQELARLSTKLPQDPQLQNELWSAYGYRWKETLGEVVTKQVMLPMEVQHWFHLKKMGPQDLAPLRSIPNLDLLTPYWPHFLDSNFSKTESAKALELLIELILMGESNDQLIPRAPSSNWLKQLQGKRFPKSMQQDQIAETQIRSVAWPLRSEARWARRGDRSGIELKMFFSHPQELQRSLDRLQQVCIDLNEQTEYENLWSKN